MRHFRYPLLASTMLLILTGCGGSSDSDNTSVGGHGGTTNPPPTGTCSISDEKQQFLDYLYADYLWNDDLSQNVDVDDYDDSFALLEALRVPEDRFSYLLTEEEYQQIFVAAEFVGFGFSAQQTSASQLKIRYVYDDSPAALGGLARGDELLEIDGVAVADLLANNTYDDALGAPEAGISREITFRKPDDETITQTFTKEAVETNTVFAPTVYPIDGQQVGYYVIDTFINRTGEDLNTAYDTFAEEGIDELIIDVRYNGGGLIRYANQASSQAAGNNVLGEVFVQYQFNDNNAQFNESELFNLIDGVEQLDLERVFVLTTGASCSSSELIINSLSPFVDVVVIGEPTCGKPVGQVPEQICDKRTFVVNFELLNANDEGDYFAGIAPTCSVNDAIVGDWADPSDPLTAAANDYIASGSCPAVSLSSQVKGLERSTLNLQSSEPTNIIEKFRSLN